MPKSTKVLIFITIVLSIAAFFSFKKENEKDTISTDDALFAVADSGAVDQVSLQRGEELITLKYKVDHWLINDTLRADQAKMNDLLQFLYKVQVKRPVFKELTEKAIKQLKEEGIGITIFTKGEQIKKYTIATNISDPLGALGVIEGFQVPYLIEVPGTEAEPTKIFEQGVPEWRDKTLFYSTIGSISQISVWYKSAPADNFNIFYQSNKYYVEGMGKTDSLKLYSYLDLYKRVTIKSYLTHKFPEKRDSLLSIAPDFRIELKDKISKLSTEIGIFYKDGQKGTIYALAGKDKELVSIKPSVFEYLLQKRSFFEPKK